MQVVKVEQQLIVCFSNPESLDSTPVGKYRGGDDTLDDDDVDAIF